MGSPEVITAVFCESAIESAQQDQFTLVQSILADKENHLEKARWMWWNNYNRKNRKITVVQPFSSFADWSLLAYEIHWMLVFCPEVRELFVRLGATSATGSITFQMLEESINSDAATQMQLFHVFSACGLLMPTTNKCGMETNKVTLPKSDQKQQS